MKIMTCKPEEPFYMKIVETQLKHKFKIHHLELYKGRTYLIDHVFYFKSTTSLLDVNDTMMCQLFLTTFKELALMWFS